MLSCPSPRIGSPEEIPDGDSRIPAALRMSPIACQGLLPFAANLFHLPPLLFDPFHKPPLRSESWALGFVFPSPCLFPLLPLPHSCPSGFWYHGKAETAGLRSTPPSPSCPYFIFRESRYVYCANVPETSRPFFRSLHPFFPP